MGLSAATNGAVYNNILTYQRAGREVAVEVGSDEWYGWLDAATSFTFSSVEGAFTAHKERASNRRGGWYWRAYRQRQGRLLRFYLGVSARVTPERLRAAASRLAYPEYPASEEEASQAMSRASSVTFPVSSLLATRLQTPRLPLLHVPRPRAVALLEQGVPHGLTLVCAPAGSGKTTLLAEWAAATSLPVAWLSLEASENDPARFFAYLRVALSNLDRCAGSADRLELPSYAPNHERALTALLNNLEHWLRQDVALVLDDYHLITNTAVHEMLHFFLDHLPARLHVVIGSRVDPPLPLARLRARGQLSELRAQELRFVSAEVKAFVQAMGYALSDEATDLLERRTEGWITGIQLLALALRGHSDAVAFLRASGSTHRFLLDYLSEEVLAQQSPETQHFLLRTSMLERLCGPLCDAVTDQTDGHARLAELLRSNLFVSALDDVGTWYRYHPLFAEALRAHLQKQEPALLPELYRRASYWYEQQQDMEAACDYALRAADFPRAAQLLGELLAHLMEQGRIERLRQWMDQLPAALIAASPQLSVASIWIRLVHRQSLDTIEEMLKTLEKNLERQMQEHAPDSANSWVELQGELALFRAASAFFANDLPLTRALLQEAAQALSAHATGLGRLIFYQIQIMLSLTYRASGDLQTAEKLLLAICTQGVGEPYAPMGLIAVWSLAGLYEAQGRLRAREQLYADVSREFGSTADMPALPLSMLQVSRAALLYEWNRLPEAAVQLQQALLVIRDMGLAALSAFSMMAAFSKFSSWLQARLELVQGHTQAAREILQRMEPAETVHMQLVERTPPGASRARLALALDQPEEAYAWERSCGKRFDDVPEAATESAAFFDYTTLARTLITRGRVQHDETALAQALTLLANLRAFVTRMNFRGWLIEVQMLTALALQAQRKTKQALSTLGTILAEAEAEGYVRLFADEGWPMERLLAQVAPPYTSASRGYLQTLQAACLSTHIEPASPAQSGPETRQTPVDPLSKREQEVLTLLATGLSNQQIADQLVISLNTAKRHVKHILAKLVATNRTGAVTRARELHLL